MGKCVLQGIKVIVVLHCINSHVPRHEDELTVELKSWLWNLNHNYTLPRVGLFFPPYFLFSLFFKLDGIS